MKLYEQLDVFTDYWFDENSHSYSYKGTTVTTSVTQLVSKFVKPFDKDYWLANKSKKLGISADELSAAWQQKAAISTETGTLFHSYMEHSLAGKHYDVEKLIDKQSGYCDDVRANLALLLPLGRKFIEDTRHNLVPIRSEVTVGVGNFIAGQIDQLFYNKASGQIEIWDWKTNNDIRIKSPFNEKLLHPLNMFDACEYSEYSLQLNLYKEILCRSGILTGNCYFVWFNRRKQTYICYKSLDFSQQANEIITKLVE